MTTTDNKALADRLLTMADSDMVPMENAMNLLREAAAALTREPSTPSAQADKARGEVACETTDAVIAMLRESDAKGLREYGVTVDRTDMSAAEWIDHAASELGDSLKYLFALKRTITTPQPQGDASPQHPDDEAVDLFAAAMKKKLAEARAKGRGGWDGSEDLQQRLSDMLRDHVAKGDPRDVANFACFLWNRGESIAPAATPQVSGGGESVAGYIDRLGERIRRGMADVRRFGLNGSHALYMDRLADEAIEYAAALSTTQARPDGGAVFVSRADLERVLKHGGPHENMHQSAVDKFDDAKGRLWDALEVPSTHPTPAPDAVARLVEGKPTEPGIYAVAGFHIGHPQDHAIVEVIERDGELLTNLHECNSDRNRWDRLESCSDRFRWWRLAAPFTAAQQEATNGQE